MKGIKKIFLVIFVFNLLLFFLKEGMANQIFEYKSEGRRDPFLSLMVIKKSEVKVEKPLPMEIVSASEYRLIGLIWDKKQILALIQKGEKVWIVGEGDLIEDLRVSKIGEKEGEVILEGEKKIIKIKMGAEK